MKRTVLNCVLGATFAMFSTSALAQDVDKILSVASDVSLRSDNGNKVNATADALEMYTVRTEGEITKDFVGLMSFKVPAMAGYTVKKATLRLVTERAKGTLAIYAFGAEVTDADTYNSQKDNIAAARKAEPLVKFLLRGTSGKAVFDGGVSSNIDDWTNNIDLTSYVKSAKNGNVNMLLCNAAESTNTSIRVYSSDAKDVTNEKVTPNFTFAAADLVPQLTVVYEVDADQKSDTSAPVADTWIREGNKDNHGSKTTMELCSYVNEEDAKKNKLFLGLMSFEVPSDVVSEDYTVESASLRLVSERVKGARGVKVYGYSDFEENTIYANESEKVDAAINDDNIVASFQAKGSPKAMGIDVLPDDYKNVEAWTNTIDLTEHVASLTTPKFALLLVKDNSSESTQFYTREIAEDVVNAKDNSIVFAADDLKPQLTVVYKKVSSTGVDRITLTIPANVDDKVYNLQGVRMKGENLPAGIYIKNGKKFVVK